EGERVRQSSHGGRFEVVLRPLEQFADLRGTSGKSLTEERPDDDLEDVAMRTGPPPSSTTGP
ncbi:MAG TPA: hypothetical protein VGC11_14140, partial [Acidimicrobiia bacterium]